MVQERLYSSAIFLGKTICSEHLKKISYFHVFFWERTFIFRTKNKIIFSGRSSIIFLDEKKKSYSSVVYLERPSFQNIWKKNMVFRAV